MVSIQEPRGLLVENEEIIEFLEHTRLFRGFDRGFLEEFAGIAVRKTYKNGKVLIRENEANDNLYLLVEGVIAVYCEGQFIYNLMRAGDIVGEMSLVHHEESDTTAITDSEKAEMLVFPNITECLEKSPEFLYKVYTLILIDKLKKTTHKAKLHEENLLELKVTLGQLKRAKMEIEEGHRSKSQFLMLLSHEIRNPMNILMGMVNLLSDSYLTPRQKRYLNLCQKWGGYLLGMVNKVLVISQLNRDNQEKVESSFDLVELLEEVLNTCFERMPDTDVELQVLMQPDIKIDLLGNPGQVRQTLLYVLENAVKFTKNGSIVLDVQVEAPGSTRPEYVLCLMVKDTGIGIPRNKLSTVFEPFTQADTSLTRPYEGAGLGLTAAKNILEYIGGSIRVESEEGMGSTVYCSVPFKVQAQSRKYSDCPGILIFPRQRSEETTAPHRSNGQTLPIKVGNILLVEDNSDNIELIQLFFEGSNYTMEVAKDGQAAVDRFISTPFDLILMDIQMPVMDGYEATRMIRTWEMEQRLSRTPIVALTAHSSVSDKQHTIEAGCDLHLVKPITRQKLLATIGTFCKDLEVDSPTDSRLPGVSEKFSLSSSSSGPTVFVSIRMKELIPTYLGKKRDDVTTLFKALDDCNYEDVALMGHTLKGSGGAYGLSYITEIGKSLQHYAAVQKKEEIRKTINELSFFIENVRVYYQD